MPGRRDGWREGSAMRALVWSCVLSLMLAGVAAGEEFSGRVVGVTDGDTITVLAGREQRKVRLAGVDAPERGQAFGQRAKQALGLMVFGREVRVVSTGRDRYERTLGIVRLADGSSVNERMVENGWAWHYVKYSKDGRLGELEARARAARRGLWADADPVAPWEFRASGRRRGLEE
ncbi:MAG: thermonuclease family protein [Bryobacter sp.]|jgi:endonuclease YncB( thermonuclease family)|nr:thermonuclease family protein [Bryobacter sp. CoA8 C33]